MGINEKLKKNCELTEKLLEKVNAGVEATGVLITRMHCDKCEYEINWYGDYMNGIVYDCPKCHNHAYHGIYYWNDGI